MGQYRPPQGVYFLYDNHKVVYVGQTNDIYRRISEHSRGNAKHGYSNKQFDDWAYVECDDENMRSVLECLLINQLHPKYNVDIPFDKNLVRTYQQDKCCGISAPVLIERLLYQEAVNA